MLQSLFMQRDILRSIQDNLFLLLIMTILYKIFLMMKREILMKLIFISIRHTHVPVMKALIQPMFYF